MKNLRKNPGISLRSPPNHHPVTPGQIKHRLRFLRPGHIPVPNHRNLHRLFHLPDNLPVCLPRIKLLPRPPVHRHRRHPAALGNLSNLHRIHRRIIKPLANLHRHRLLTPLHHRRQDRFHLLRLFKKRRPFPVIHNLRHRTPHIYINQITIPLRNHLSNLPHNPGIRPKKLHRRRPLLIPYAQKLLCIPVLIKNRLRAHHLRHHQPAPLLLTKLPVRQIRNPRHRCQHKPILQNHPANLQFHSSIPILSKFILSTSPTSIPIKNTR